MLDLLITKGLVVDGSGSDGYLASVGVEGNTVRIIRGDVSAQRAGRCTPVHSRVARCEKGGVRVDILQSHRVPVIVVDGNSYVFDPVAVSAPATCAEPKQYPGAVL